MMREPVVCLVTDQRFLRGRSLAQVVEHAVAGGCNMIQLRAVGQSARQVYETALLLKGVTDGLHVPLIINNAVDIALAVDAAGVHIGQADMPAEAARRLLGPEKLLGVSVSTVEQARAAYLDGADYLGAGAVFPTATKTDATVIGIDMLTAICQAVPLPVLAIGGVTADNADAVMDAGARGIAAISAILEGEDACVQARRICQSLL